VGERGEHGGGWRVHYRPAAAGGDDHQEPGAHLAGGGRQLPAVAAAVPGGRRAGRPARPGDSHVAVPAGAVRGRRRAYRGGRHPRRRHRHPRRRRIPARQRAGGLLQRRASGAAAAGAGRPVAEGERQSVRGADRQPAVRRPAAGQLSVRSRAGAAVRPGCRLVRGLGAATGPAAHPAAGTGGGGRRHAQPRRRGPALAARAPAAADPRGAARREQLLRADGLGHGGPAGHPDAAYRSTGIRAADDRVGGRRRSRRPAEPGADPPRW